MESTAANVRWSVAPFFVVDDVVATAAFYRDKLGFRYERFWGEPPCFTIVNRSGGSIMLSQSQRAGLMRTNNFANPEGDVWDAYFWIADADALFNEFQDRGVVMVRPLRDEPYGCREFTIRDCNGFNLGFGQILA